MGMLWLPAPRRLSVPTGPCGSPYTPVQAAAFSGASAFLQAADADVLNQAGNQSFLVAGFFWLDGLGDNQFLCGKYGATAAASEWRLIWASGAARFVFTRVDTSNNVVGVTSTVGATAGQWHFVAAWFHGSNQLQIQVDASSLNSNAVAGTTATGRTAFRIGRAGDDTMQLAGRVDGLWIGQPSAGTAAARATSLYNSGAGRAFADLAGADLSECESFYEMNENAGVTTYCDWVGTAHLATSGGVAPVAGKV